MNETALQKDDMSDGQFASELIKHITEPCGTEDFTIRGMYIREAERALAENSIKDDIARARLEAAVGAGRILLDVEFPDAPHTSASAKERVPMPMETANAVLVFLKGESPMSDVDRGITMKVVPFILSPTPDFATRKEMSDKLGEVMMTWEMEGEEPPAELTAMQKYLLTLQYESHVETTETALTHNDKAGANNALQLARCVATALSKGYNDPSLLPTVTALQARIDVL